VTATATATATTTRPGAPRRARTARTVARRVLAALALPVVLVVIWALGTSGSVNPFVPRPGLIVSDLVNVWGPIFGQQVLPSLARLFLGLGLAIVLGVLLGMLIGSSRIASQLTRPLFEFIRAVPPPVLLPILLLVFGIGDAPKVFLIVLGCLWPILLNTVDGVRSVDSVLAETTRTYGITGWERFRRFVLPASLPRIMTGIRLALPVAIILMVVSEMYAAFDGLGYRLLQFRQVFQYGPMWAGIVIIGVLGIVLATAFRMMERRVLKWYFGQREAEIDGS
jgi:ABC-type nitrate/sulfonate/bicarbonate transport system permease component